MLGDSGGGGEYCTTILAIASLPALECFMQLKA